MTYIYKSIPEKLDEGSGCLCREKCREGIKIVPFHAYSIGMDVPPKLLFKEKQAKILMLLSTEGKEWHLNELAKQAGATYVHTSRFISECEKAGIVESERHGKSKSLKLTEKGKRIAKNVNEVVGIVTGQIKVPEAGAPAQAPAQPTPAAQPPTQPAP